MHSALDNLVLKESNIHDYDFVEVLAQGDFSTVAKAVSRKDNQVYAIKIFEGYCG